MTLQAAEVPQGRVLRPWEPWRWHVVVGAPLAVVALLGGVLVAVVVESWAVAAVAVVGSAVVGALITGFEVATRERVTMWRRLDQAVVRVDRSWRPRRPKVTRTSRGLVVVVRPVPSVEDGRLVPALGAVAQTYGLRYVSHRVELPAGFAPRAVGRERLVIEFGL